MFDIVVTEKAAKDFKKIGSITSLQIARKLKEYSANPFLYARKLSDSKIGSFRFRIGDYRAIVDIEGTKIIVLRIGHRKDIYK